MENEKNMLDKFFAENRVYSRFEAAIYILAEAKKTGGILVLSLGEIADKVQWKTRMQVSRFLSEMESEGLLQKDGKRYRLVAAAIQAPETKPTIKPEIESIKVESIEVTEIYNPPTFIFQPVQQREGVPPTKEQLLRPNAEPETILDFEKVDWSIAMNVPKLRFYKKYVEAFPSYVLQGTDLVALDVIVGNIKNKLYSYNNANKKETTKEDLLFACDRFVESMKGTFWAAYSLCTIASKYNEVSSAIIAKKNKDKQTSK